MIVVAARFFSALLADAESPAGDRVWGDTVIRSRDDLHGCYRDVFTGGRVCMNDSGEGLSLSQVCERLPFALLERV